MRTILSHRLAGACAVGAGARPALEPAPAGGANTPLNASSQEDPGWRPQQGQSTHRPDRSRATPLHSTSRHPGVQPGPTRLWHSTHLTRSPGLCRLQRSQNGRARPALLGGTRTACAWGDRNPDPSRERPIAPSSPAVHLRPSRIRAPTLYDCSGVSPTGTAAPLARRAAVSVIRK